MADAKTEKQKVQEITDCRTYSTAIVTAIILVQCQNFIITVLTTQC